MWNPHRENYADGVSFFFFRSRLMSARGFRFNPRLKRRLVRALRRALALEGSGVGLLTGTKSIVGGIAIATMPILAQYLQENTDR